LVVPTYLENARDVVRDSIPTGPLADTLHGHDQPKALAVIWIGLGLLEYSPMRHRRKVRLTLAHLSIDGLELGHHVRVIDGFSAQTR
jgi:hypothetical protein